MNPTAISLGGSVTKRPNVVWIQGDQLRADALGCYGNSQARMVTPWIDSLAEHGVRFDRCYINSPICAPARHSMLTGLYPEDTGFYGNEANRPNRFSREGYYVDQAVKTFPKVFAENGYVTANFGKHDSPVNDWMHHDPTGLGAGALIEFVDAAAPDTVRIPGIGAIFGARYPGNQPYPSEALTRNALRWLGSATSPYLVRLSYAEPHVVCVPPPPYDAQYRDVEFRKTFGELGTPSAFDRRVAEGLKANEMTAEQLRLAQVYYYGAAAWLDSQVGLVLDFLERTGQIEETIVVLDTDHGEALGERGIFYKDIFAPSVHRIPRLLMLRGTLPAGQARTDICEGLDLARTLFGLCGIEAPEQFKGRDLMNSEEPEAVYATIGYGYPESRIYSARPIRRYEATCYPNDDGLVHISPDGGGNRENYAEPRFGFGKMYKLEVLEIPPNCPRYGGYGTYWGERGWPRRACIRTPRYRLDKNVLMDGEPVGPEDEDIFLADTESDPDELYNVAGEPGMSPTATDLSGRLDEHVAGALETPARTRGARYILYESDF